MSIFGDREKNTDKITSLFDEKDLERQEKKPKKPPKVKSGFADISPISDMTMTDSGFFELNTDEKSLEGFLEILQITSKDIYALNEEDVEKHIVQFAYFNQWYTADYKIIPLNFPEDTSRQQQHILKRLNNPANQKHVPFLQQKLDELKFIESERTNREYFLFLYAQNEYTLLTRIKQVQGLLQNAFPIKRLSEQKKLNILYKLFNLNSKNRSLEE